MRKAHILENNVSYVAAMFCFIIYDAFSVFNKDYQTFLATYLSADPKPVGFPCLFLAIRLFCRLFCPCLTCSSTPV